LTFALATGNTRLSLAIPLGLLVCAWVILGTKAIRAMPVAYEEYVLTNWRAFSHFQSNGTRIVGEMLLDGNTTIRKRRCGHGTSTIVFTRSQNAPEPSEVKGLGRACVALLNLRDAEYPLKLAEWSVAINPTSQPMVPPAMTSMGQAWTRNRVESRRTCFGRVSKYSGQGSQFTAADSLCHPISDSPWAGSYFSRSLFSPSPQTEASLHS
jgi:hypothetical protein